MNPLKTPTTTRVLGAPPGWKAEKYGPCVGLPITDAHDSMYSYWSLNWKERLKVLFGVPVRLAIPGSSHPPVMLRVEAN